MLLARVDTPGESGQAEAGAIAATMTDAGTLWTEQSSDATEAEALFEARRLAYPALERLGPVLTEDVCAPRSAVPAMLEQISAIGAQHGVGLLKRDGMHRELYPGSLALQSAVRQALDPLAIFNPGKG